MATRLIPGYDFDVNETPTHDKFIEQARSLRVRELGSEILDASFGTLLVGGSGLTGGAPSTDGSLWISADGSIWGDYGDGPVKVWRSDGGWEFNRYTYLPGQGTTTPEFGMGGDFGGAVTESTAQPRAQPAVYATGAGITLFINAETAYSGKSRLLGRGAVEYGIEAAASTIDEDSIFKQRRQLRINGIAVGVYWAVQNISTSDFRMYDGWFGGLSPNSSTASQAGQDHLRNAVYGYFHQRTWGPGADA